MNEKLEKNENKKTADVLRAENLVRDYVQYGEDGEKKKEVHVLKGLNFSIQRQEFVGIMGRSGCGKTTLLKLLGMIDRQTGGKLFFEEHDTEDLWKDEFADIRRRKIGFVFQDFYLMDSLSVRENIMLPKILDKKSAKECMEESQKYAEQFGITHLMNKKPYEKSVGKLKGDNNREEYDYYCNEIVGKMVNIKKTFEKYPVLRRCVEKRIA